MISEKLVFFGLIFLAVVLEGAGDVIWKISSIQSKNLVNGLFILGFVVYMIGGIFWALSLRHGYLSKAITIFTVLNLIIIVLVGVIFFKEDLSWTNRAGVLFGIIAVVLMEI